MANYNQLKAAIRAVINENHNNEITGTDLQNVLVSMINSLVGYQFVGIATPTTNPGTPDARVFYIATESGVYSNFGGITLTNEVAILRYGDSWEKLDTGIAPVSSVPNIQIDNETNILTHDNKRFLLIEIEEDTPIYTGAICGMAICGVAICGTN